MTNTIIRNSRQKDLILFRNIEKVYFVMQNDVMVYNSLDYDKASDYFNKIDNNEPF